MNIIERCRFATRLFFSALRDNQGDHGHGTHDPDDVLPPLAEYQNPPTDRQAAGDDQMDEMAALRGAYTPNQSDTVIMNVREFPQTGGIALRSEHFILTEDGLQRLEEQTVTLMGGNEIGPPSDVGGICVCGRPIRFSRIKTCHVCGVCVCSTCGRYQPIPSGLIDLPVDALILCPTHLKEFRNQFPHWHGAQPVSLPPDMSISVLGETGGAR